MNLTLESIRHDHSGFEALTYLHDQVQNCFFETIIIDMTNMAWFDADMCPAFGAILYRLGVNLNTVNLINIPHSITNVLSKNGFLCHYGRIKIHDRYGTTISYKRFDVKDDRSFSDYIDSNLMNRPEIPIMTQGLRKKFSESIFEIFSNAVLHSSTTLGIFSCGQFFPQRDRLDFSVADLGIGIQQNIKNNTKLNLSPTEAIMWAVSDCNTTKKGPIPGGLGLKLLNEFIDLNNGRIQIVSAAGYWIREERKTIILPLTHPFPGTVVTVEINTADVNSYMLASESNDTNIF